MSCPICGGYVEPNPYSRPRIYCSPNCQEISKFMSALEKRLLRISPSERSKKLLAGDLFRLANIVTNSTNRPGVNK